jgi:hypothetical protein
MWSRVTTSFRQQMLALVGTMVLAGCGGDSKPVGPSGAGTANLRLDQVVFTQVVQDEQGSLPLIAGVAAAAKVLIIRSTESVAEVPVVLRLFRGRTLVRSDTTRTVGVLGPVRSLLSASAEFLVPASYVAADVSWQVEIDPKQTVADSTRSDNILPVVAPAPLHVVSVPPLRLRLVPVILARHDSIRGDVTAANAEAYVRLARQILPASGLSVTVGAPIVSLADFGAPPVGGARGFWEIVIAEVDRVRVATRATDEYWFGVVPMPAGYAGTTLGGFGYVPSTPGEAGVGTHSSVGLAVSSIYGVQYTQMVVAHELGHNFGRGHAPGCAAGTPIDTLFPNMTGAILGVGHDVWSWANGLTTGATSIGPQSGDVMSYCDPKWIGPYSYGAIMRWRMASGVIARVAGTRTPVATP